MARMHHPLLIEMKIQKMEDKNDDKKPLFRKT